MKKTTILEIPKGLTGKQLDQLKGPVSVVSKTTTVDKEYQRLANRLGTSFAQLLREDELTRYLEKTSTQVYPMSRVKSYLDAQQMVLAHNHIGRGVRWKWSWTPLRQQDRIGARKLLKIYTKPIPAAVLMSVEKIVDDLGGRARFFVTDFLKEERAVRQPIDPFLAVSGNGVNSTLYVIERWDEPTFRS